MQHKEATSPAPVAPEQASRTSKAQPLSRGWLIVGSLAVLAGTVMGFIMSSLGK